MENINNPFEEENVKENENIENATEEEKVAQEDIQEEKTETQEEKQEEVAQEAKDEYKEKYEDLNNKYIRLAADFDNFRKRTIQEKEELSKYATVEVLKKIAAVLDTFDRAKEQLKEIDNCQTVKDGYEVAYKQIIDTLTKIGMEEIEA